MGAALHLWRLTDRYEGHSMSTKKPAFNYRPFQTRLKDAGCSVEVKNGGHHFIVSKGGHTADYWPSSGKWKDRAAHEQRNGLDELVTHMTRASAADKRLARVRDMVAS